MYAFDAHCDYLWMRSLGEPTSVIENNTLKKSVFAVFEGKEHSRKNVTGQVKLYKSIENDFFIKPYIAFEGLSWVEGLNDAEFIMENNAKYVSPVWNSRNDLGGSCYEDGPITLFGKCFLEQLDKAGVYIDLAHSGERMFYSCIERFENVMFSHGNVFEVHSHPRNIKKQQILSLIHKNAFFGLTFYTGFTGGDSFDKFFEHVEFVLSLGGSDILGIGSDLDGCDNLVGKSKNARVFDELNEEFCKRNYSDSLIEKIMYKNLEARLEKNPAL